MNHVMLVILLAHLLYSTSNLYRDDLNSGFHKISIESIKYSNPMRTIKRLLELDLAHVVKPDWDDDKVVLRMMKSLKSNLISELPYLSNKSIDDDKKSDSIHYIHEISRELVHIFYKYRTIPLYEYKHAFIDSWNKYAQLLAYNIDFKEIDIHLRPWEYFILDEYNPNTVIYLGSQGFYRMWGYLPDSFKVMLEQTTSINSKQNIKSTVVPKWIFECATNHELPHVREMMKRTIELSCKVYWELDFLPQIVLIYDKIYNIDLPPIIHKQRILDLAKRIFNSSISSILASATYLLMNNHFDDALIQELNNAARLIISQLGLIHYFNLSSNRLTIITQLVQNFAILAVHLLYKHNGFIPNGSIKLFATWANLVEKLTPHLARSKLFNAPHPWEKYLLIMYDEYSIPDCEGIKEEIAVLQANLGKIISMYDEFTPETRRILDEAIKVIFGKTATFPMLEIVFNDQCFLGLYSYLAFMLTRLIMHCTIVNTI